MNGFINLLQVLTTNNSNSNVDLYTLHFTTGARGSVVGWGAMLQAGRSRVQVPMRSLDFFFNWLNPPSRTTALGSTQPLTEMSTGT
jgi:hypothetical protein